MKLQRMSVTEEWGVAALDNGPAHYLRDGLPLCGSTHSDIWYQLPLGWPRCLRCELQIWNNAR